MKFTRSSLKGIEDKVLDAVEKALEGTGILVKNGGVIFSPSILIP